MNFIIQLLLWFGIQCEVRRGTKRIVLIFHKYGFTLKFGIFQPIEFLRLLLKVKKRGGIRCLCTEITRGSDITGCLTPGNIEGFMENWREYRFSKKHPSPFLFPIYFSLFGIVNVLPIKNHLPSDVNKEKLRILFGACAKGGEKDGHHFTNPENFCFHEGYLCMTDYGSPITQKIIRRYWDNLQILTEEFVRNHQ